MVFLIILTRLKHVLWGTKMKNKKAQNIIEYVLLFVIVATAITITNRYISRSMSARLKQIQEELSYKNDR